MVARKKTTEILMSKMVMMILGGVFKMDQSESELQSETPL